MTVVEYIRGLVGVVLPDEAIAVILLNRDVCEVTTADSLSLEKQELIRADVYSYCLTVPSTSGYVEDADGGWKHREGGTVLSDSDKRRLERIATAIYKRYGETSIFGESKITIVKL
jgi:hypothetical protein